MRLINLCYALHYYAIESAIVVLAVVINRFDRSSEILGVKSEQ
ncbi:hypothetical protein [Levilactobacillus tongjiangensis]|uniref:Uncharacterized protein n=1 Tax=Levilactobacillus tongjiangensis TaxID=2486023 RepID=A0ABW1SP27_9LACO|nr:hypothetical protein [Levilactobacillus tongjiangensis]